jgi:hypothetical protein
VKNNRTGRLDRHLDPASVYQNIVRKYGLETGLSAEVMGLCVHSLRATAATNALSHDSDIAKVQEWLGHANVSTSSCWQLFDVWCGADYRFTRACCDKVLIGTPRIAWLFPARKSRRTINPVRQGQVVVRKMLSAFPA